MTQTQNVTVDVKEHRVHQAAYGLYCKNPDWVTFFKEILGLNGIVRRTYPAPDALAQFERTDAYKQIQHMLTSLRQRRFDSPSPQEPTRVITVRLPKSLHEALRAEAHEYRTSMNKLCISKLLQFIEDELVPTD